VAEMNVTNLVRGRNGFCVVEMAWVVAEMAVADMGAHSNKH